ncbi:MAG: hypothetical protein ACEQSR_04275 [Candidatus Methylacidiphilales bacterium]
MENDNEINIIKAYSFFVKNELKPKNQIMKFITKEDISRFLDISTIEAQDIIDKLFSQSVITMKYEYETVHFNGDKEIKPVGYRFLPISVLI